MVRQPIKKIPVISMRGITKSFPGVLANDRIDLDIYESEIHVLLGENGAGKSTLMKVLFGYYRADSGEILSKGKPIAIDSPSDARSVGIGMVFQDLNLIPAFSVAENIALFLPKLEFVLDPKEVKRKIVEISDQYDLHVNPRIIASQLSIGEQQKVEIVKLLISDARVLILDEPTRVLAPHEVQALFRVMNNLRSDGYAIILITHKIKEVLECADRITILRGGRSIGTYLRNEIDENKLIEQMFEKHVSERKIINQGTRQVSPSQVLELRGISTTPKNGGIGLCEINLTIQPGEIVGIAGVSGNGQKELCDVILGMDSPATGKKLLNSHDVTGCSVQEIRKKGVSFIPENPHTMASVPFMTVLENMALTQTKKYARNSGFWIDWAAVEADVRRTNQDFGFALNLSSSARALSGGNLQRMVILREMSHDPQLIIASYLTRGLDVQSAIAARDALCQAAESGTGILLISEDLDELFMLSDRLIVMYGGRIVGKFMPSETDIYEIGHLMTGSRVDHGNIS